MSAYFKDYVNQIQTSNIMVALLNDTFVRTKSRNQYRKIFIIACFFLMLQKYVNIKETTLLFLQNKTHPSTSGKKY